MKTRNSTYLVMLGKIIREVLKINQKIEFAYPFCAFSRLNFINCYASVIMLLENIHGKDDYNCEMKTSGNCTDCGNCRKSTVKLQEDIFFLFDTLSGRSSLRPSFTDDGANQNFENSPEVIDFLFGLTGYQYTILKTGFPDAIQCSLNRGIPILARIKGNQLDPFRVIIGCEDEKLMMADKANAQGDPQVPSYEEIDELFIIGEKNECTYTLVDGLMRIQKIMLQNQSNAVWDTYIQKFRYWDEKLYDVDLDIIKNRTKRICDIAWHNFNCHNFAEVFRHKIWLPMQNDSLNGICHRISVNYDLSHTKNWQIIGLYECRDWTARRYNELDWGYCTSIMDCLENLKRYDEEVLNAIGQAIQTLQ